MNTFILILTTLSSGLIAGLFYSWTISVTPGLAIVDNESYLKAFQSMNRAILNPVFFAFFMGLIVLLPILAYLYYESTVHIQFWYVLSATVLYIVGVMAVTITGNIPLNNKLEALEINSMNQEEMKAFRLSFENKWNKLNIIRTICSSLSFMFLIMACIQNNGN